MRGQDGAANARDRTRLTAPMLYGLDSPVRQSQLVAQAELNGVDEVTR